MTVIQDPLPAIQDLLPAIQDLLLAVQDPLTVIQDPLPAVQDKMEKQTGVPTYQYGTKGNTNEDRYVRIHPYDRYDVAD